LVATTNAAPPAFVTISADSGKGSLREALESNATQIKIKKNVEDIAIEDTLVYASEGPLNIKGFGQTIIADGDFTLLSITNGADLSISNLSFKGIGGFSGAAKKGDGKGIFVDVPQGRTGTVHLDLKDVSVSGVAYHGVHVSDCTLEGDVCGASGGGEGIGSSASVEANLKRVSVSNVGYGKLDADGFRIDERGDGDIIFNVFDSSFSDVGADGIKLDEGGAGNVIVRMEKTTLERNGGYCLVEGDVCVEGIMPLHPFDDLCCDEGELDLDDGFDIDEAGEGSVQFFIKGSDAIDNKDEGFDFDEEGSGDIVGTFISVTAKGNEDEGIKCSEAGEGDVDVVLTACTMINNLSNDGIEFESEDEGRTDVVVVNTQAFGNTGSADLKVVQDDKIEQGSLKIVSSSTIRNVKTMNVILEETRN
jgi:hypothetical protein